MELGSALQMGSLAFYRRHGDSLIWDLLEGVIAGEELVENRRDDPADLDAYRDTEMRLAATHPLIRASGPATVARLDVDERIRNSYLLGDNCLIWCASMEPQTPKEWALWHDSLESHYDHTTSIGEPAEFAQQLAMMATSQHRLLASTLELRHPTSGRIEQCDGVTVYFGPVVYLDDPRKYILNTDDALELIIRRIFTKTKDHRHQREYRPGPVSNAACRSGRIVWQAASGASAYDVEWRHRGAQTTAERVTCSSSCFLAVRAEAGKELQFRVRGISQGGSGPWTAWHRVPAEAGLAQVTGVGYRDSEFGPQIYWSAVESAVHYEIDGRERGRDLSFVRGDIGCSGTSSCGYLYLEDSKTPASFKDASAFRVRAVDGFRRGPWSAWLDVPPQSGPSAPGKPQNLKLQIGSPSDRNRALLSSDTLSWDPVPGATEYVVFWRYFDTNQDFSDAADADCGSRCTFNFHRRFRATVKLWVIASNRHGDGPRSEEYRQDPEPPKSKPPGVPGIPSIEIIEPRILWSKHLGSWFSGDDGSDVEVHWQAAQGAASYEVQYRYVDVEAVPPVWRDQSHELDRLYYGDRYIVEQQSFKVKASADNSYRIKSLADTVDEDTYIIQLRVRAVNAYGRVGGWSRMAILQFARINIALVEQRNKPAVSSTECRSLGYADELLGRIAFVRSALGGPGALTWEALDQRVKAEPDVSTSLLEATKMLRGCYGSGPEGAICALQEIPVVAPVVTVSGAIKALGGLRNVYDLHEFKDADSIDPYMEGVWNPHLEGIKSGVSC